MLYKVADRGRRDSNSDQMKDNRLEKIPDGDHKGELCERARCSCKSRCRGSCDNVINLIAFINNILARPLFHKLYPELDWTKRIVQVLNQRPGALSTRPIWRTRRRLCGRCYALQPPPGLATTRIWSFSCPKIADQHAKLTFFKTLKRASTERRALIKRTLTLIPWYEGLL